MKTQLRETAVNSPRRGCAPEELSNIFPTVVMRRKMPDAEARNARLRDVVLAREKSDPGIQHSNVGGWHSSADLWEWQEPEIRQLCAWVIAAAEDLTATMVQLRSGDEVRAIPYGGAWVNLLREGGYNKVHNHPGAVWSAVYYVSAGEPDPKIPGNGNFEFMDPRPGNIHGGKEVLPPEAGTLMVFPSWLYHYVNPYFGKGERISIAFNMNVEILRDAPGR